MHTFTKVGCKSLQTYLGNCYIHIVTSTKSFMINFSQNIIQFPQKFVITELTFCADIAECESDPCMNGGTCFQNISMPNFRKCNCAAGYTGVDCGDRIY